jgi:hypothetical protein
MLSYFYIIVQRYERKLSHDFAIHAGGLMITLNQAWAEIRASTDWQKELDRLCGIQRQAILDFEEHLEFAQFWCDLLASQAAKSYLAEYKAE